MKILIIHGSPRRGNTWKILNKVKENVNFVKVDIDQSMDLAQKFKIVSVPTLKVFKNGEEVDTLMGFMPKEVLKSKVEAHI